MKLSVTARVIVGLGVSVCVVAVACIVLNHVADVPFPYDQRIEAINIMSSLQVYIAAAVVGALVALLPVFIYAMTRRKSPTYKGYVNVDTASRNDIRNELLTTNMLRNSDGRPLTKKEMDALWRELM